VRKTDARVASSDAALRIELGDATIVVRVTTLAASRLSKTSTSPVRFLRIVSGGAPTGPRAIPCAPSRSPIPVVAELLQWSQGRERLNPNDPRPGRRY
jgi:hypothetical protein